MHSELSGCSVRWEPSRASSHLCLPREVPPSNAQPRQDLPQPELTTRAAKVPLQQANDMCKSLLASIANIEPGPSQPDHSLLASLPSSHHQEPRPQRKMHEDPWHAHPAAATLIDQCRSKLEWAVSSDVEDSKLQGLPREAKEGPSIRAPREELPAGL